MRPSVSSTNPRGKSSWTSVVELGDRSAHKKLRLLDLIPFAIPRMSSGFGSHRLPNEMYTTECFGFLSSHAMHPCLSSSSSSALPADTGPTGYTGISNSDASARHVSPSSSSNVLIRRARHSFSFADCISKNFTILLDGSCICIIDGKLEGGRAGRPGM